MWLYLVILIFYVIRNITLCSPANNREHTIIIKPNNKKRGSLISDLFLLKKKQGTVRYYIHLSVRRRKFVASLKWASASQYNLHLSTITHSILVFFVIVDTRLKIYPALNIKK